MIDPTPGWYGKLAMLGDFASRRLEPDWIASCDRWLAHCVQASRLALGDAWLPLYLQAPSWRFAWAPGIVDERWWFGVLIPSCDNVGRYFPLLLAQAREQPPFDRAALDHLDRWWAHLMRAAVATLGDGATLEAFEADLARAPTWPQMPLTSPPTWPAGEPRHIRVGAQDSLHDITCALAAAALQRQMAGSSLWWPLVDGQARGALLMTGLPAPEAFAAMLRADAR